MDKELVLGFHGVGDPHVDVDSQERVYWWDRDSFVNLLDQIYGRPVNAVPGISLTFDDGNASDALIVLPELVKRGLTATFFVCANRIGKTHYLNMAMIKDLVAADMTIGSHGMDHRDWRLLDSHDLEYEISGARQKLEDLTQKPITTVAIPFGSYDRRVLKSLAREDWDIIYTSDGGMARLTSKIRSRNSLRADEVNYSLEDLLRTSRLHREQLWRTLARIWKAVR